MSEQKTLEEAMEYKIDEQVEKVSVSLSQKINLGNYETRDFFVAMDIKKYTGQSSDELIEWGKAKILPHLESYYRDVKDRMETGLSKEEQSTADAIGEKTSSEELRKMQPDVAKLKSSKIIGVFNTKLKALLEQEGA